MKIQKENSELSKTRYSPQLRLSGVQINWLEWRNNFDQVKEELLVVFDGVTRWCEVEKQRVPAGPRAWESPEGFTRNLWKPLKDGQVGTCTRRTDTVGVRWCPNIASTCSVHVQARSIGLHNAMHANLASRVEKQPKHTHKYCINVRKHRLASLATSATQRKSALPWIKTKGSKAFTWCECSFIHPNLFVFLWQSGFFFFLGLLSPYPDLYLCLSFT